MVEAGEGLGAGFITAWCTSPCTKGEVTHVTGRGSLIGGTIGSPVTATESTYYLTGPYPGANPHELEGAASVWGIGGAIGPWGGSCNYVNLGAAAAGPMGGAVAVANTYKESCSCSGGK